MNDVNRRYQLLIVDDDEAFRASLCSILEPCFDLVEAGSGEEAIEIIEFRPVHIALLDMHMKELTGLDTLRFIKQTNEQAPCILITASISEQLVRDAEEAAAFSVLPKPVSKRKLVQTMQTAMTSVYDDPDVLSPLWN